MEKQQLVEKLLNERAEMDNKIDLNAYALGLTAMYEAIDRHIQESNAEYIQLLKANIRVSEQMSIYTALYGVLVGAIGGAVLYALFIA